MQRPFTAAYCISNSKTPRVVFILNLKRQSNMIIKPYVTQSNFKKIISKYPRAVQSCRMVEGTIVKISRVKPRRFNSQWRQLSRQIILSDHFAKAIKSEVYLYKINIRTNFVKKLKLNQNYCFYNFELESGTSLTENESNCLEIHLTENSTIECAPTFEFHEKKKKLLFDEISKSFNGLRMFFSICGEYARHTG